MKQPIVVIADYGVGNVFSVANAIKVLGYKKVLISDNEQEFNAADAIILPGVGAFDEAVKNLRERNLHHILNEQVLQKKKPILGICVGMQMMAGGSEENGWNEGLNWIPGKVTRLNLPTGFAVPHVGWNNVTINRAEPLFQRNPSESNFYFDHSYYFETEAEYVAAYCDYGRKITAAVQLANIFGVQFHPEKSQTSGLKLFRSFFNSI